MAITNRNYLLGILTLILAFSYFDRFVFSLMLESIKQDLSLTDSQIGILTGFGFAFFYALAGLPIARWADRGDRVTIAALSAAVLGGMVALCSIVTTFIQLVAVRAGVAVGEAGIVPTAQSLVTDNFNKDERPRAMAILSMGYSLSVIVGYLLGGLLLEAFGWRLTFLYIGLPGFIIAIIVRVTLSDTINTPVVNAGESKKTLGEVLQYLWGQQTFRHLLIAFCAGYFFFMGILQWLGAFFIRSHGVGAAELGSWLALSWGVFGLLGTFMGGFYASRFAAGNEKKQMQAIAISMILYCCFSSTIFMTSDQYIALIALAFSAACISFANGPVFSAIQSLVDDDMRSTTVALLFLFSNFIGMGFGPLVVGLTSDLLVPVFGSHSLRYALLLFCPGSLWVAYHYWKAGDSIHADADKIESQCITSSGN